MSDRKMFKQIFVNLVLLTFYTRCSNIAMPPSTLDGISTKSINENNNNNACITQVRNNFEFLLEQFPIVTQFSTGGQQFSDSWRNLKTKFDSKSSSQTLKIIVGTQFLHPTLKLRSTRRSS